MSEFKGINRQWMNDQKAVRALNDLIQYAKNGYLYPTDHVQQWMLERLKDRINVRYNNRKRNLRNNSGEYER